MSMASASPSARPATPDSHESSSDTDDIPPLSRPPQARRTSSIRFSKDTRDHTSPSRYRSHNSSDDITAIQQIDGQTGKGKPYKSDDHEDTEPIIHTSPKLTGNTSDTSKSGDDKIPWYKRVAEKYGSISLENKGSVARDHLALERTFLAWLRTSLAFASIGIAVTQLFRLNTSIASKTKRHEYDTLATRDTSDVPFSPLLGHSLSLEVLQLLQSLQSQLISESAPSQIPDLGPTLLDQLLLLPPRSQRNSQAQTEILLPKSYDYTSSAVDDPAAKLRHLGKPLGATFIGISIVVLLIGFHRYFESQHWIIRGKFPASRVSIALVGLIAGALIVASLVVVLVVAPTSYEKK